MGTLALNAARRPASALPLPLCRSGSVLGSRTNGGRRIDPRRPRHEDDAEPAEGRGVSD